MKLGRVAAGAALLFSIGCGSEPIDPDAEIRRTLAAAEAAARDRDLAFFKRLIAPDYADPAGRDERAVEDLARFHVLRNPRVHTLVRVREVELVAGNRARVVVLAALAGTPIPAYEDLARIRADLFRFDLVLARQDDGFWSVVSAVWKRVTLQDFL